VLNVLLCVESRIYGQGLSMLLRSSDRFGEVSMTDCLGAMARDLDRSCADVIVIDAALCAGQAGCWDMVRSPFGLARGHPVVVLGLRNAEEDVLASLEAGAAGCVTHEHSIDELINTIEAAAAGELLCPPRIARRLQERLTALASVKAQAAILNRLSQKEHFILSLLEQRMSNKQIARHLGLELSTIKNHVHSILVKLRVSSRTEAVGLMQVANSTR
jgi:DNA-binding NarL/FixJ family response regulator